MNSHVLFTYRKSNERPQRQRSQYDVILAQFRCDVDGINKKRQIVQRKRNKVTALKGLKYIFESKRVIFHLVCGRTLVVTMYFQNASGLTLCL